MLQTTPALQPEIPRATERPDEVVPPWLASLRVVRPVRDQPEVTPRTLDDLVSEEHPVRAIWALLERLDLSAFYRDIRAVLDSPGRPASDPRVLLALWIAATVDGVGSARRLAELSEQHHAYRWLRGGVPLNYHLLADFRVVHQQALDDLLSQTIAVLLHGDLVTLRRVAQDGVRVRASAGAASFRRRASLEHCLVEARAQVARLAEAAEPGVSRQQQAARERAARERLARVEAAIGELPAVEAIKAKQQRKLAKTKRERVTEARVSTTDPAVRVLKMADGGFRPALNVQVATDTDSRIIVGVQVTNHGSDGGLAAPLEQQVAERAGRHPDEYLIDGGLATRADITTLARRGVTVYAPVEQPRTQTSGRGPTDPRPDDSPEVAAWRARMGTTEAQVIYKERSSTAEWTNAQARTRHGLQQFSVRGVDKITSVMLLLAVSHNLLRWLALSA